MKRKLLVLFLALLFLVSFVFGFTALSLDKIDYISNDPELNKPAFALLVVEDGAEQYAVGTFSSEEMTRKNDGIEKVTKDFTIKSDLVESKCSYNVRGGDTPIYEVQEVFDCDWIWLNSNVEKKAQECKARSDFYYYASRKGRNSWGVLGTNLCCFVRNPVAEYGFLRFGSYDFKDDITVEVNGEKETLKVSNADRTDKKDNVYVKWTGSLVTGKECPQPYAEDVRVAHTSVGWKFIDVKNYNDYRDYHNNGMENCLQNWINKLFDDSDRCVNGYNSESKSALSSFPYSDESGNVLKFSSGVNWGSGTAFIDVEKHLVPQFPTFLFRVDADWLGIFLPVGEPKIREVDSECFFEDKNGIITVKVKNEADVDASFEFDVDCDSPFYTESISSVSIDGLDTETVRIPIFGTTQEVEEKAFCKIKVSDSENPDSFDEDEFQVCVKNAPICEEGQMKCEGKIIQKCDEAGNWGFVNECDDACDVRLEDSREIYFCTGEKDECEKTADCPQGQTCKEIDNVKKCVAKERCDPYFSIAGTTIIPNLNPFCHIEYSTTVKIILVGLAGLLIFFFVLLVFKDWKDWKKNKTIYIIVAVVISLLVSTIVYFFWWLIIIVIILLLIMKFVVKKYL